MRLYVSCASRSDLRARLEPSMAFGEPMRTRRRWRIIFDVATTSVAITVVALVTGHPGVAEVTGGSMIVGSAILLGWPATARAVTQRKPGRVLLWDLVLVAAVLLALVGVGIMALAMP